ncbi:unnamed protein product [Coffea canephora]|uniref:Uncharacterized protein n=1 Tax=Coffea canephora TaxID=49390 RepID=A0A068U598_COFCA|nr:unnamed protein product [Coffea canephora]
MVIMESDNSRKGLAQVQQFICYAAMRRDSIPCNRRGHSYYNCDYHGPANPYTRGCTDITRCPRNTE